MNLTKSERVRLGVFIAAGTTFLVGGIILLAGLKLGERRDLYNVAFTESVSGLEPSAQVKFQGLRVGRVENMRVDPDNPGAIRVVLSLDPETVLYEGTRAALDMSGLTGLKTINLSPGDPRSPRLEPGSFIPEEPSLMGKLGDRAEQISERIEAVTAQLIFWTGPENRRRVERLLDNTNTLLEEVNKFVSETRAPTVRVLDEVAVTSKSFRGTSDEVTLALRDVRGELRSTLASARTTLDEARRIMQAVDSKEVRSTVASASSAMKSLDTHLSATEVGETIERLNTAMTNIATLAEEMDLTIRASREDLVQSIKYVRQATQDLREFSRIIAQDPSVLLRGTEMAE